MAQTSSLSLCGAMQCVDKVNQSVVRVNSCSKNTSVYKKNDWKSIINNNNNNNNAIKRLRVVCVCACNAGFIYVIVVAVGALWLLFYASPRWGNTNPLVYVAITGTIGSLSVMGCKALGVGIKQTVSGDSQLMNPVLWIIAVTVATCITIQVRSNGIGSFNSCVHSYQ